VVNPKPKLNTKPKYFKAGVSRGLLATNEQRIEREGGDYGAGLIRGASIITRGEALGHGMWIDAHMLEQTADAINNHPKGVKVRFTHPSMSGDGLGSYLGRAKNAFVLGDQVYADVHFSSAGHKTPDGDLAEYVMSLADNDADAFGVSISFQADFGAEDKFVAENEDEKGSFISPDPDNKKNYIHARLYDLRAADIVDEPAANPDGLFHRSTIAHEADALLSYALGMSSDKPEMNSFSVDADRVTGFVQRFLAQHDLEIVPKQNKESSMEDNKQTQQVEESQTEPETNDVADEQQATEPEPQTEQAEPETPATEQPAQEELSEGRQECKRFIDAFGEKGGVWYSQGMTFAQAQEKYTSELKAECEKLAKERDELQSRLSDTRGEDSPVTFTSEVGPLKEGQADPEKQKQYSGKLPPNLAKMAASINIKKTKE
jgi:hypothetical protein